MWEIPASVSMQIYDVSLSQHVELRWLNQDVDIDEILNGEDIRSQDGHNADQRRVG